MSASGDGLVVCPGVGLAARLHLSSIDLPLGNHRYSTLLAGGDLKTPAANRHSREEDPAESFPDMDVRSRHEEHNDVH